MTHIHREALLPYTAENLFALVNDVAAYPQYMEGCVGAEVLRADAEHMVARLDLARGGIRQSFTTHNRLEAPHRIVMSLVDGPFSEFEGVWQFQALNAAACKVTLDLRFTMASRLAGFAVGRLFSSVANQLVDAISLRARQLHGRCA